MTLQKSQDFLRACGNRERYRRGREAVYITAVGGRGAARARKLLWRQAFERLGRKACYHARRRAVFTAMRCI